MPEDKTADETNRPNVRCVSGVAAEESVLNSSCNLCFEA